MKLEAKLYEAFINFLSAEFTAEGIAGVDIVPAYQVVKNGPPAGKAVVFQRIASIPRGHVKRRAVLDDDQTQFTGTETQAVEVTYQFTALCPIDATEDFPVLPADLADLARGFLTSDRAMAALEPLGYRPQSITNVRDVYSQDESGRFENQPTFDIVLTYGVNVVRKIAIADPVSGRFYRAQED